MAGHMAVGTHAAHGHWASGETGCGRALEAGERGHCRLNRQDANKQSRRELDTPFHLLIEKIGVGFVRVCVLDHTKCETPITAAALQFP